MKKTLLILTLFWAISARAAITQVSPLSFGADPTGVRDSTAAIQRFLDAADLTTLECPAGVFKINATGLRVTRSGKHFKGLSGGQNGYQTIFKAATTNMTVFKITAGAALFSDITIQGEAVHVGGDGTVIGVDADIADCDATFLNCTFVDLKEAGRMRGRNVTFDGCSFLSVGYGPIFDKSTTGGTDMRGYIVQNSRFHGLRFCGITFTPGAALSHAFVTGNTFDGLNITTIATGEINALKFSNNTIYRCVGNGLALTNNLAGLDSPSIGDSGITIENNTFFFKAYQDWPDCLYLSGPNFKVINNTITGCPHFPLRLTGGGDNSYIHGNVIDGAGIMGMVIENSTNVVVSKNRVMNWGKTQEAATHYSGIYAIQNTPNIAVVDNALIASPTNSLCDGISLQALAPRVTGNIVVTPNIGIYVGASCTNALIALNTIIGATDVGISDQSDVATRHHGPNHFVSCALDVFGEGPERVESLKTSKFDVGSGGFVIGPLAINASSIPTGAALNVLSTNAANGLELSMRVAKSTSNKGSLGFYNGFSEQAIFAEPSVGSDAQDMVFKLWDGAQIREVIRAKPTGSVEVDSLAAANSITAASLDIGTVQTVLLLASNLVTRTSVKWWGAVGDGVTDDTAAVQSALDYASTTAANELMFVPRGDYKISTLYLTNNLFLTMDSGARFVHSDSLDSPMIYLVGSGVATLKITGGILDGNKAGRTAYWDSIVRNSSVITATNVNKSIFLDGVTITNSVRTAICIQGGRLEMDKCSIESPNEHNGTSITHCVFAQPESANENSVIRIESCKFNATSWELADLYKQAAGIFVTLGADGTSKYKRISYLHNWFRGIGCTRAANPSGPIDTYNGTEFGVAMGNHIYRTAYSGFKIQRSDNWIVSFNTIEDVYNTDDNECFAIDWSPTAREGASPFVSGMLGQTHHRFICIGNVITNSHRTSIYVDGPDALIQGNAIGGNFDSDAGNNLPIVSIGSNVQILDNTLYGMTKNGIWQVGGTNITIAGNNTIPLGASATDTMIQINGSRQVYVQNNALVPATTAGTCTGINVVNAEDVIIDAGNRVINAAVAYSFNTTTNCIVRNSDQYSCTAPINYTASPGLRIENNNWQRWQYRMDTNGLAYMSVQNLGTNTAAAALLEVLVSGSYGAYIAAYPTNSANTRLAGRGVLGINTANSGLGIELAGSQDYKISIGTNVLQETQSQYSKITGSSASPLQLDSSNANGTLVVGRNQGSIKSWWGYLASVDGFSVLDHTGASVLFKVGDSTGNGTFSGSVTGQSLTAAATSGPLLTLGSTNAVPASTNAVLWFKVSHGGNDYAVPLMKLP